MGECIFDVAALVLALKTAIDFKLEHFGWEFWLETAIWIYWFWIYPLVRRRLFRWQFAKRPDRDWEIEWTIGEDRIEKRGGSAISNFGWDIFASATESEAGFSLYTLPQYFQWLPRSAFTSPELADKFSALVKRKIKSFKSEKNSATI